jgi:hypothetical protein
MKKIILYSIISITLIIFSSCKGWLESDPGDGLTLQDYWKSKEQVNDAVIGCYSSMIENDNFIWYLFLWGELRSDLVLPGSRADNWIREALQGLYTPRVEICNWAMVYKTINQCNTVLKFAKNALDYDKTLTISQLKSYEAEALGIRALMYFYLARVFGDVPVILEASVSDDQNYFVEKSPQIEVLKQVKADLDTAEKYIVSSYGNEHRYDYDIGRITKYAIWAMQADLSLWIEDFTSCVKYCDYIINSKNYGLVEGEENTWFQKLFYDGNSNEGIFELQYDNIKRNETFYRYFAPGTNQKLVASSSIINGYFASDPNDPTKVDIRGDGGAFNLNNMAIWKYIGGPTKGTVKPVTEASSNWIFYRYADILLMKAEALNEMGGNYKEVFNCIKEIRQRAKVEDLITTSFIGDSSNTEQVANYILNERARELAYEGKRWFDLLRYAKRNNYNQGSRFNIMINTVTTYIPSTNIETIRNRYRDTRSHYLPIYYNELQRNYKLKQNPFYEY